VSRYRALQEEQTKLKAEWDGIIAKAEGESRVDLTAEETARIGEIKARLATVAEGIKDEEERRAFERSAPALPDNRFGAFHDRAVDRPWGPVVSENASAAVREAARRTAYGEFMQAVAFAHSPSGSFGGLGGQTDPRLYGAASGLNSGTGSEGGFLVGSQFSTALLDRGWGMSMMASMCTHIPIGDGADSLEAPIIDETSRANGSRWGGVRVYRRAEADTVAASKPKFGEWEVRLEDLMGICYVTDRNLRDAVSLGAILEQSFAEEFAFKVDDECYRGSGVGEMLGMLNAPALVSVAKEAGQTPASVVFENIVKMWSRMPAFLRSRAIWCINQDVEPALFTMSLSVGTGGVPVYLPANGLSGAPYGTLLGRPVMPMEQAETLGTVGDICFCAPSEFVIIEKGGIQADQSIHVRFIYGERTFRWIYPINGRPKWKSAVTPYKGGASNTRSPYVVLATRA
jgi:HK97 family phage major capsid protein